MGEGSVEDERDDVGQMPGNRGYGKSHYGFRRQDSGYRDRMRKHPDAKFLGIVSNKERRAKEKCGVLEEDAGEDVV